MTFLMFRGPAARLSNWCVWGFIILLAGLTGNGGGFNFGDISRHDRRLPFDFHPHMFGATLVSLIILGVTLAVIVVLFFMYLQARFRFVFVEGVIAGEPRVRGIFRRTAGAGLSYFVFRLILTLVFLLFLAVPVLLWGGALIAMIVHHSEPGPGTVVGLILTALLYILPLVVAVAVVEWFVHHLVLPHMWLRGEGLGAAFRRAWSLAKRNFGATALLLVLQVVAHLVAAAVSIAVCCVVGCVTCCVWIWPALMMAGLAVATVAAPMVAIVTVPVIIVLALAIGWLFATALAPIPVFFRSWTLAFVAGVDPTLSLGAGVPSAAPPAAPPAPGAPPDIVPGEPPPREGEIPPLFGDSPPPAD